MAINKHKKHQCPCCGYFTFEKEVDNTFAICDVCYWEDDGVQLDDPNYTGGANTMSLNQARENYKRWGAIEERLIEYVRPPKEDELAD